MKLARHINHFILGTTLLLGVGVGLVPSLQEYSFELFLVLVFILGIPHGSLDHVIYLRKSASSRKAVVKFIGLYVGIMAASAILWFLFPSIMLPFFLVVSAYHFGQSQFYYLRNTSGWFKNTLYTLWGIFLLSGIIRLNFEECLAIFESLEYVSYLGWMSRPALDFALGVSGILTIALLFASTRAGNLLRGELLYELTLLVLIGVVSYLTNAVFAFALYFGIWHSLKSMVLEYQDLKKYYLSLSLSRFIRMITPFSLAGIAFLIITYFALPYFSLHMSPYMLFIILISCLTFPHLFVMADLYTSFSNNQES